MLSGLEFNGYEIHMGDSGYSPNEFEISGTEEAFVTGRNKMYVERIFTGYLTGLRLQPLL